MIHLRKKLEVRRPERTMRFESLEESHPYRLEPLHWVRVGTNSRMQRLAELLLPICDCEQQRLGQERLFGVEVITDGGQADPCSCRDIASSRARIALLDQAALCPQQQRLSVPHIAQCIEMLDRCTTQLYSTNV